MTKYFYRLSEKCYYKTVEVNVDGEVKVFAQKIDPSEIPDIALDVSIKIDGYINEEQEPKVNTSKLKQMLENLKTPPDYSDRPRVVDVLQMIRDRQEAEDEEDWVEMTPEEKAALDQTDEEFAALNIDTAYMALVRKVG